MAAPESPAPPPRVGSSVPGRTNSPFDPSKLLIFITIALVIAGLYFGRIVLIPLALAILLSFVFTPIVARLERWGLARAPAVLLVVAAGFIIIGAIGWTVSGQMIDIAAELPSYEANIQKKIDSLHVSKQGRFGAAVAAVEQLKDALTGAAKGSHKPGEAATPVPPARAIPVQVVNPLSTSFSEVRSVVGPLLDPLATAGIVIIFTIFMLIKREDLRDRVIRLAGRGRLGMMTTALDDGAQRLSRYLLLQALVNASYGVVVGVALYFIGVPHALLWGVLTALLRYIPYVGILIAACLSIGMALAVSPGWAPALLTLLLFVVLEIAVGNFIEPTLYGSHTGISSLAVLVAAVFWTMLWGPIGLILSTPMTVCVIVLGRHVPQFRFLEIALGDEPALPPEAQFYQRLLAMDESEVQEIAHEYLKEKPLTSLYDGVIIPALGLAEQDRHANTLGAERRNFIYQSISELVEELGESAIAAPREEPENGASRTRMDAALPQVVCLPARDEADEIVAMMVAQLAPAGSYEAVAIPIAPAAEMLEQAAQQRPAIVCVSALPPAALPQARALCKRLRVRVPGAKLVLALWKFEGGPARAQERAGGVADVVVTNLADLGMQLLQMAQCDLPAAEHQLAEKNQRV